MKPEQGATAGGGDAIPGAGEAADEALAALRGLRIGCVRYLNARPLIEPLVRAGGTVRLEHPSRLAALVEQGELDAALVPVFESLRSPGHLIVDGVSISSLGPVWSVFVAYQGALSNVREVVLDPASLTSANLCKVLFAQWGAAVPRYLAGSSAPEAIGEKEAKGAKEVDEINGRARLLIGNQAIAFRAQHGSAFEYLDFGEEWLRRTSLPFVFAVWQLRPEVREPSRVAAAFRELARQGGALIPEIAACDPNPEFAQRYLTQHIRFGMGAEEKKAIALFRELLIRHNQLPPALAGERFRFV